MHSEDRHARRIKEDSQNNTRAWKLAIMKAEYGVGRRYKFVVPRRPKRNVGIAAQLDKWTQKVVP